MVERLDGQPAAARRRALRCRAVRPLVVRGAGLDQLSLAQNPLGPANGEDDQCAGVSRPLSARAGEPAIVFELGLQGLLRSVARGLQRLDLSPPARGRGPDGGVGPAIPEPQSAPAPWVESSGPRASLGPVER